MAMEVTMYIALIASIEGFTMDGNVRKYEAIAIEAATNVFKVFRIVLELENIMITSDEDFPPIATC